MLTILKPLYNNSELSNESGIDTFFRGITSPLFGEERSFKDFSHTSTDIIETDDEINLTMDLPGVDPETVKVNVENRVLTIQGERHRKNIEEGKYHLIERSYGKFVRSFRLPTTVNTQETQARYHAGVLKVCLPKHEEVKPKSIDVKVIS